MLNKVKDVTIGLIPYIIVLLLVLLIKQFVITPMQVKGDSMYPTLKNGDFMVLNKLSYNFHDIERFDIVVVDKDDSYIIKRVIGLPNETIKYENNELYINGEYIEEDYIDNHTTNDFEYETGDNCYFVLGDNREISLDSRYLGCFDKSKIIGKTSFTFFPFTRFGFKN